MIIQDLSHLSAPTIILLLATGIIIGFLLALTGGGGSVVCVPLLLYMVKIEDTHLVIGTSAMAVAVSALFALFSHAINGNVRWKIGLKISAVAITGALLGAELGKMVSAKYLLLPFSLLMLIIAVLMAGKSRRHADTFSAGHCCFHPVIAWIAVFIVGVIAGFLGIGGGFLVVPLLVWCFRFSMVEAVATSLMVVFAMGVSTSASYATAGKFSVIITAWLIAGGIIGGWLGSQLANRLSNNQKVINGLFSAMLATMAFYMLYKNL